MSGSSTCVLAADIGGTNTRLAAFNVSGQQLEVLAKASYPSQQYDSLSDIIAEFLAPHSHTLQAACFGVAGPVLHQTARITNLPWQLSAVDMAASLDLKKASLLNDLEATAWGLRTLQATDTVTLQQGMVQPRGNAAIIAAGTGLGEAGLYIGGGIAPKILQPLQSGSFIDTFCARGRMRDLLERIPVRVILNDETALQGAAAYAAS